MRGVRGWRGQGLATMLSATVSYAAMAGHAGAQDGSTKDGAVMLDPVVVSATRSPESLASIPGAVTVVTRQELDEQTQVSTTLGDILEQLVPGLAPSSGTASNFGQTLRGRNILVLIDGVPQNTTRNVSRDLLTIDPAAIERIEVIRGATAVYGNGAAGGVINIITRRVAAASGEWPARLPPDRAARGSAAVLGRLSCAVLLLLLGVLVTADAQARTIRHPGGITEIEGRPERVVVLEHRYVEIALTLGLRPVGVAELQAYEQFVGIGMDRLGDPRDVGLRQEPNLEVIAALKPDLIIGVRFRNRAIYEKLSTIAPTLLFDYTDVPANGPRQLDAMREELRIIAAAADRHQSADAALADLDQAIAEAKVRLGKAGAAGAPVVFAQFPAGSTQIRLFTDYSIVVQLLEEIGLTNAWSGRFDRFGFNTVGPETLALLGDVHLLFIVLGDDNGFRQIADSPLWPKLPFVQAGQVHPMPARSWPFGGPEAAAAFVRTAADLLTQPD